MGIEVAFAEYVPNAEIPTQPRHGVLNGTKRFEDQRWAHTRSGEMGDVPSSHHIIDIPFDKEVTSGAGTIKIPVMKNYGGSIKVLKFNVKLIDAKTGKMISRVGGSQLVSSGENSRESFIGYRDCLYEKQRCATINTNWESLYIVCDGIQNTI